MVNVTFSPEQIQHSFNDDPEFRLYSRYWNGTLEFGVGNDSYTLTMSDGQVSAVDKHGFGGPVSSGTGSGHVQIHAPADDWAMFVQDPAPPFYLDYYSASAHHDFSLGGDPDLLWAYYPAIRRTSELFRKIAQVEGE